MNLFWKEIGYRHSKRRFFLRRPNFALESERKTTKNVYKGGKNGQKVYENGKKS